MVHLCTWPPDFCQNVHVQKCTKMQLDPPPPPPIRLKKRQWILKETMKILSRCISMNLAGRVKEGVRESDLFVI